MDTIIEGVATAVIGIWLAGVISLALSILLQGRRQMPAEEHLGEAEFASLLCQLDEFSEEELRKLYAVYEYWEKVKV